MNQQPGQQGFHHLQHQMQASPIPGQQPQQMPVGMSNEGMLQNMAQNQQQQFQLSMQQPQPPPQQPQNVPGRPQHGQQQLSPADAAMVQELTNRYMAASTPEEKQQQRLTLQSRMDPQTFQRYQAQGVDPLILYYRQVALNRIRQERQTRMAQAQQQAQMAMSQQQPQNVPTTAPPMQQQRSMNPSPLNGQAQPPVTVGGNQDFGSFMGNMGNLIDQQQQGVMAQEAGQMVVPASSAQRNATPQPGVMPGQQINMNDQRAVPNPNVRAQQQQQMFNAQQAQQQRMQHAAQQQSQAAARATAQAKAQQMGLQGQPGGMGPGPMPPQQSPAMGTLNTPLRTPSQQGNNPEQPQINPNAQFGQPLDPRFMQGGQRQLGPGNGMAGLNPIFAGMPPEHQQRLAALPPDKLNDVVSKWNEQRGAQMNAANAQAGRPSMPMQANNQIRPGQQVPQPGQFNHHALNQFMIANPGQRPPPALTAGMNPQQQQLLQLQLQRFQQNALQQRNAPLGGASNEQRTLLQMDNMEFPASLLNHQLMPRGFPPEFKKWGPLKQWAQANLAPEAVEGIKTLQKIHYQGLIRAKNQQAGQSMAAIPNGVQVSQVGAPLAAPAGISAPVAPMGQNPMQIPNGIHMGSAQIRQPTQQEIQAARNHPSGKMATATDDQIRAMLMRNQLNMQQHQQRQNAILQMQMSNQMPQMNGQQPRPGVQPAQQGGNLMAAQNLPQAKQAPSGTDPAIATSAANNARPARPSTAGRTTAQNSSPAQPPKNLKRASSDDVVEVSNPNTQQTPRPTLQQNQGQKPSPHQPPRYTEQQLAALSPEERKKYEQAQRLFQASRGQASELEQLRTIMQEELQRREPLPDIPMDQETKQTMVNLLREIHGPLTNVGKAVPKWFQITRDVARARLFFRTVSNTPLVHLYAC